MSDQLSILDTSDGSNSVSSVKYNATYHSIHGAIEESMHVFISAGLHYKILQGFTSVNIFEMGFGTGLNAFLTSLVAQKHKIKVNYHSIELHPIQKDIYQQLNFHQHIPDASHQEFIKMHELPWNQNTELNPNFSIKKIHGDLCQIELDTIYDLIYYDAFAPSSQSELWEEEIHRKIYNSLNSQGALTTYCAQGKFKRMLKSLGYTLDKLPGPGRKHEMTRAIKA